MKIKYCKTPFFHFFPDFFDTDRISAAVSGVLLAARVRADCRPLGQRIRGKHILGNRARKKDRIECLCKIFDFCEFGVVHLFAQ